MSFKSSRQGLFADFLYPVSLQVIFEGLHLKLFFNFLDFHFRYAVFSLTHLMPLFYDGHDLALFLIARHQLTNKIVANLFSQVTFYGVLFQPQNSQSYHAFV